MPQSLEAHLRVAHVGRHEHARRDMRRQVLAHRLSGMPKPFVICAEEGQTAVLQQESTLHRIVFLFLLVADWLPIELRTLASLCVRPRRKHRPVIGRQGHREAATTSAAEIAGHKVGRTFRGQVKRHCVDNSDARRAVGRLCSNYLNSTTKGQQCPM